VISQGRVRTVAPQLYRCRSNMKWQWSTRAIRRLVWYPNAVIRAHRPIWLCPPEWADAVPAVTKAH